MNIDWKRIKTFIKFHLGMKCVVQYGDKWVVTCRKALFIRCVLGSLWSDNPRGNWWPQEYMKNWSIFSKEEYAIEALQNDKKALAFKVKFKS